MCIKHFRWCWFCDVTAEGIIPCQESVQSGVNCTTVGYSSEELLCYNCAFMSERYPQG